MTLGDIEKRSATSINDAGKVEDYWFAMPGKDTRKVFVSGKVNRLSDINALEESFQCSLQIIMYWYITKDEYEGNGKRESREKSYLHYKELNKVEDWTPAWHPVLRLPNCIHTYKSELFYFPNRGLFPVRVLKKSGLGKQLDLDEATIG